MEFLVGVFCFGLVLLVIEEGQRRQRTKDAYNFKPANALGGAAFADNKACRKGRLFKGKGIRIGSSPDGRHSLHYPGAGHLLTVAAARTGKGASLLINAILSLPRRHSLIVIDPKAELASVSGFFRRKFGKVFILNPFEILPDALRGLKHARYNPMASLGANPNSRSFHADCDKLADAICWDESGRDNHWIISARLLISGIIAALAKYGAPEDKNLVTVRDVITGNGRSVFAFARECMTLPDTYIKQKLARFAVPDAEESKELNGIISTADTQTGFIGNEAIAESLKSSDFRFGDLKGKLAGATIFICLPLNKLDVCSKYFRLILASALSDLLDAGQQGKGVPVLAIVDEIAQIGPLKALADAWGMAAGAAGLQLWAVYQDVSQIMNQFSKTWETVIQNCGATMWFGARDQTTREYVSKLSGVTEVLTQSRSVSLDPRTREPHVGDSMGQHARPLLHPHEVGELGPDEMLLFCEGVRGVVRAKRKLYFRCSEFRGKYRDNPYFQKQGGSWLRWFF